MQLCFLSGLTSSEWAAWVQAIGSILAIGGAAFAAIWQARKQSETALRVQKEERKYARVEITKSLLELSRNCEKLMEYVIDTLNADRSTVHEIAEGSKHLDFGELVRVEQAVLTVPLHGLPSKLVTYTMMVSSAVRQFREKVQGALQHHREMDASAFEDLFKSTVAMKLSLGKTCSDIEAELRTITASE